MEIDLDHGYRNICNSALSILLENLFEYPKQHKPTQCARTCPEVERQKGLYRLDFKLQDYDDSKRVATFLLEQTSEFFID